MCALSLPHKKQVLAPFQLIQKYDRPGPRYTSYPTVPVWTDSVGTDDYANALDLAAQNKNEPLSLYLHLPFCEKRCYFCGCNVFIPRRPEHITEYVAAIITEIHRVADRLAPRNIVTQLHFGGGTPTYLSVDTFGQVMAALKERFVFTDDAELSIEVDPRVTTRVHLNFLADHGFNRISMGVQDFDPSVQKSIGREQSYDRTKRCIEFAREKGFKSVNLDLIYGLPQQTVETFRLTIKKTIELSPDRLAVYSFAYLPSLMANQKLIKEEQLPNPQVKYELSNAAYELFTAHGYRHIGMDHYALPDDELTIAQHEGRLMRNFMGYTVSKATDLIGIGISAIGLVNNTFVQNDTDMAGYLSSVNSGGFATKRGLMMSQDDLIREYIIAQIMCNFTLDAEKFKEKFGLSFSEHCQDEISNLETFIDDDLLVKNERGLQITDLGRGFVRNIAMVFDAHIKAPNAKKPLNFSRTI